MAQDHGLCRKKKQSNGPGARAATAGPCCSCQRDSLAACKLLFCMTRRSWRTWYGTGANKAKMNGAKQNKMNGGKNVDEGSGHGRQRWHGRQNTAGRLSVRHRPQNNRTAHSWPALQQKQQLQMSSCLSPCSAGKWGGGECKGVGTQEGGCRPT